MNQKNGKSKLETFHSRTGEHVDKPWGYEDILEHNEVYTMKILHINPGQRLSLQYHNEKVETIYVLKGTLLNYHDDTDNRYSVYMQGTTKHVNKGEVHRFGADTKESVTLLECSTSQLDDVVRLADDYQR
jgi:mannose-6-phosphate isomerase